MSKYRSYIGLFKWGIIRHRTLIPVFILSQGAFALAIVCGMALYLPEITEESIVYLSSGGITLGIISIGCVIGAQVVVQSKQNGLFAYQKTLPVSRTMIVLVDILLWEITALPGIAIGCLASIWRFHIQLHITVVTVLIFLLAQFVTMSIGFCIAYWCPPAIAILLTQVILLGGMLFSPIVYPAERLPEWTSYIYQVLPFIPMTNLIRSALFQLNPVSLTECAVVIAWCLIMFIMSTLALSKRD